MFITEKSLNIDTVEVNLREGEQLGEAFLNINPYATVPVLELDNGTRLTTTAGCRAYLEAAHPTPALLGRDNTEKGIIADLTWRIENEAFMAVGESLRNRSKGMRGRALTGPENYEQIPELAERGSKRASRYFPVLNDMIGDSPFIVGDNLSCADIDAFIFVEFAKWIKVDVPDDCENIKRWHQSMSQRPSAQL